MDIVDVSEGDQSRYSLPTLIPELHRRPCRKSNLGPGVVKATKREAPTEIYKSHIRLSLRHLTVTPNHDGI